MSGAKIDFRGYDTKSSSPKSTDEASVGTTDQPAGPAPQPLPGHGLFVSSRRFSEGSISVDVEFATLETEFAIAEIIVYFDPTTSEQLNIGLGAHGSFALFRRWTKPQSGLVGTSGTSSAAQGEKSQQFSWQILARAGNRTFLRAQTRYQLQATVRGSIIKFAVNDVDLLETNMPFPLADRQVGIFAQSRRDIRFENFRVDAQRPRVFVAMQFNMPDYDALYRDVIAPVCDRMDLDAYRADETYSPGLVVADLARQIRESRLIIAELSSVNPNVFYEVGYADAIQKPVILVADRKTRDLPFDVRPYRTLFYENSIGGKKAVEEGLLKYLQTILSQKYVSAS